MGKTYKAVEITKPGTFRLVEKPVVGPGEEQVRIRVEACVFVTQTRAPLRDNCPASCIRVCRAMKQLAASRRLAGMLRPGRSANV